MAKQSKEAVNYKRTIVCYVAIQKGINILSKLYFPGVLLISQRHILTV